MRVSTSQIYDSGIQNMTGQQARINETQDQLSSGRRVLQPSDDPTAAARTLDLEGAISSIERFNRNAELAENRLSMSETALEQAGNNIQRIRELAIQAANGSQDQETRNYIASEVRERYEQLIQLANTEDGNGEYLFSGAKTRTQPFTKGDDDRVAYNGDQSSRQVRVGPGREMSIDHSGFDAFMKIPNGNGEYQVREDPGNTGTGVAMVVEQGVQRPEPPVDAYRIRFAEDEEGELRYAVQRTHDEGNPDAWEWVTSDGYGRAPAVADAPRFEPGQTIEVEDGVRIRIDGEPDAAESFRERHGDPGDTFTVSRSQSQSLFESVREMVTALEEKGDGAEFRNAINRTIGDLDLAMENMFEVRAEIGARLSGLDSERASNEAALIDLERAVSTEEDLDYAEATGRFSQEQAGLQAAQMTFRQVQDLSLFNYL